MRFDVPHLDDLDLAGKRVLVRVDFNVPQDEAGHITDDTRIRASLETIEAILAKQGRPVLMSHLGRPEGKVLESLRLKPVAERLEQLTKKKVVGLDESIGPAVEKAVQAAPAGAIVLLENVRFHKGETKGDVELAKSYAKLGDVFVNDAFGTSHRAESSVSVVAQFLPSAAGRLLEREVAAFRKVLENPARPLVAILGGAKVSDKLPVVANLIPVCDAILIGGGMAYTFLKALGHEVGGSKLQADQLEAVKQTMAAAEKRGCRILLPSDHVVADALAETAKPSTVTEIPAGKLALDIGPETRRRYAVEIAKAKTVVWNGPMGVFEWESFRAGTAAVAKAVAEAAAYTVVGGGDSVAAVELLGVASRIKHISTGGGASLELLGGKALPGIEALLRPRVAKA
ncbi:MAG: phosphoglycerate kinase [Planctomycetes bacterium]|nr:phosphoglycerate kinase [Planctomycetota bacterium]